MQQPTCSGIRIRTVKDAEVILHAVSLGLLPMLYRRLDDEERLALRSGCIYIWEERSSNPLEATGQEIQRFTEGRSWGPSRAREDFLLYYEKEGTSRSSVITRGLGSQQLIKQTYSVFVDSPKNTRKWHLNAYYTQETLDELRTVDDVPELRSLRVPEGQYICARTSNHRRGARIRRAVNSVPTDLPRNRRSIDSSSPPAIASEPHVVAEPAFDAAKRTPAVSPDGPLYRRLAPLEYLQKLPPRSRDPVDDQVLKSFRCIAPI